MNYNKFSNYFGLIAHYKFPKWLQTQINCWYVDKFKIDMSEFKKADDYDSLNSLFTRKLLKQRVLEDGFISPSDGLCLEVARGDKLMAYSIKNHYYQVGDLLKNSLANDELEGEFNYLNIYLSPSDYHHYHAPCDMQILSLEYVPGELFSVAKNWLKKVDNLYPKNERVILKAKLENNKIIWLVFVGAWNVGKMKFDFEPRINTNSNLEYCFYKYENLKVKKGEHLGNFELGSTIVLISQNEAIRYDIKADQKIKFGEKIGELL